MIEQDDFDNIGIKLIQTKMKGNQRKQLLLFDLYNWKEDTVIILGNEPRKILNVLSDKNKFSIIDMEKRAIRLNRTIPRYRFLSVKKNNATTEDIIDGGNRTYTNAQGLLELIFNHPIRSKNKTEMYFIQNSRNIW